MTTLNESTQARSAQRDAERSIRLTSSAFADGAAIPERHTADGENVSPQLTWSSPPPRTESFALICEDPDAPSGDFVHWLVWNIPATRRQLEAGELKEGLPPTEQRDVLQGKNGFALEGYSGPRPPPGKPHRYLFRLFALDRRLTLPPGAKRAELDRAMAGHILAQGLLVGTYRTSSR